MVDTGSLFGAYQVPLWQSAPRVRPQQPVVESPAQQPMAQPQGAVPQFMNALTNREAMLAFGSGLLQGGPSTAGALGAGFGNMQQAMRRQQEASKAEMLEQQARQQEALQTNQALAYLKGKVPDDMLALAQVNPQVRMELLKRTMSGPAERKIIKGADGYQYYADDGSRVLPNVQIAQNGEFDEYGFPRTGAISQKMRGLTQQGVDKDRALGIATGRYTVSINPQTGERVIVDIADGSIVPLRQPEAEPSPEQQPLPEDQTLFGVVDKGTGAASALAQASTDILGQMPGTVGEMATFPEQVKAAQRFKQFERNLIRALALGRFSNYEQEQIRRLIPTGAFKSPATVKAALESLDQYLASLEESLANSSRDMRMPIATRNEDAAKLQAIRQARREIGNPDAPAQSGGLGVGQSVEVEPGITITKVR